MRVLIIDNFDSFTNNIAHSVYTVTGEWPRVEPNTRILDELDLSQVDAVIIGPGPGNPMTPRDVGVSLEVITKTTLPILGVCLGHQLIAQHFGSAITLKSLPNHGVATELTHDGLGLFLGVPEKIKVVQYNSWLVANCVDSLRVTARDANGAIMAFEHKSMPIFGLQFHPESVATEFGDRIIENFLRQAASRQTSDRRSPGVRAYLEAGGRTRYRLLIEESPAMNPSDLLKSGGEGFWLDSENSNHADLAHSYFGIVGNDDIYVTYEVQHRRLTVRGPDGTATLDAQEPWDVLHEIITTTEVKTPDSFEPEFTGGFVGYLGYELKNCGREVDSSLHSHLPDLNLVLVKEFFVLDNSTGRVRRCRLTSSADDQKECQNSDHSLVSDPITHDLERSPMVYRPGPVDESSLNLRDKRDQYVEKVERARWQIAAGESYEICLTTSFNVETQVDPLKAYKRMRSISPVPYGAYLKFPQVCIISNSPERFIRVSALGRVESKPIKGTRKRSLDTEEDARLVAELERSEKDLAENLMVTDLVRHDLSEVCRPGSVTADPVFAIESYSSVHQMVSTVTGHLAIGKSSIDAIKKAFPGGSMTGAPKIRTMEIIECLESAPRGVYAGSIGWLSFSGAVDLSIVIRTAVISNGVAQVGVGGAVTALSNSHDEFEEVLVKASIPNAVLSMDHSQ